jgi:hypothetical protein
MFKTLLLSVVLNSYVFPSKEDVKHIEEYRKVLPQALTPGLSVVGAAIDPFEGSIFYQVVVSPPLDIMLISAEGQYEIAKSLAKMKCKEYYSYKLFENGNFYRYLIFYNNKFLYTFTVTGRNCNIKEA